MKEIEHSNKEINIILKVIICLNVFVLILQTYLILHQAGMI